MRPIAHTHTPSLVEERRQRRLIAFHRGHVVRPRLIETKKGPATVLFYYLSTYEAKGQNRNRKQVKGLKMKCVWTRDKERDDPGSYREGWSIASAAAFHEALSSERKKKKNRKEAIGPGCAHRETGTPEGAICLLSRTAAKERGTRTY